MKEKGKTAGWVRTVLTFRLDRRLAAAGSFLVLLVMLVPIIRIMEYTVPWYDDYNYALVGHRYWEQTHSFMGVMKGVIYTVRTNWYAWQGTFSSIFFMSLMPGIWGENQYFWGPLFLVALLLAGCFAIAGVMARDVLKLDRWDTLLLQSVTAGVAVALIHSSQAGFYWYNAGVHYVGMHSFMLLLTAAGIHLYYVRNKAAAGFLILWTMIGAVIAGGSNYVTSLQGILILVFLILLGIALHRRRVWMLTPALTVYAVSFYKNISAPGNSVRQAQMEGAGLGMDAFSAIIHSFLAAAEYLFRFGGWIMLAVLVLMIPVFWNIAGRTGFRFAWPGLVSLASFCLFATGFTPSFYSLGHEGLSRTLNAVKITYQILLLLNEMYWIGWLVRKREAAGKSGKVPMFWWFFPAMGAVMLFIMLTSSNIAGTYSFYGAYYYVHTGEAFNFYQEYLNRVQTIKEGESSVAVEPYHFRPWILCVDDLSEDGSAEPNRAIAEWYGKEDISCKVQQ